MFWNPDGGKPPKTGTWFAVGCMSICESTISQEDADLCAARQSEECSNDDPPGVGNPRPPRPRTKYNTDQECPGACGVEVVVAGTIASYTQADADARAMGLACKRADAMLCFTTECPLPSAPTGTALSIQLDVGGGTPPYTFAVTAGTLPAGTTLSASGLLTGTPTTVQHAVFSVTATDAVEATITLACDIFIVEPIVGYWTYDNYGTVGPDDVLLDSTGNGHRLIIDSPYTVVPGKVGNCMSTFQNACESLGDPDLAAFDNIGTTGFTICGWTKFDFDQEGTISIWVASWVGYYMALEFDFNLLRLRSNLGAEVTVPYPADGAWHFFRSWFDVSDGKLKLQLDMGTIAESAADVYANSPCSSVLLQGGTTAIPDTKNGFDETGFWKRVLTNAEVLELWNSGAGTTWPDVPH